MSNETQTADELREHLIDKATTDEAFRAQLIADPKAAIKEELGLALPPGFNVKVHEEAPDTSHVVLPPSAALGEEELEQAAGGTVYRWSNRKNGGRGGWMRVDEAASFWDDFGEPRYE